MRKIFNYWQIDYEKYPSEGTLNRMGAEGWELVCIEVFETRMWDNELGSHYTKKFNKATYKREIVWQKMNEKGLLLI